MVKINIINSLLEKTSQNVNQNKRKEKLKLWQISQ